MLIILIFTTVNMCILKIPSSICLSVENNLEITSLTLCWYMKSIKYRYTNIHILESISSWYFDTD